jgi:Na+/H+ antiporter NhaC
MLLGCLIFIDDYFNCLTVGSVMRPVTDKHKISRAKLAYLIDSTAAPICIIAPISSWAAAVSGFVKGENGISIFIQSIPFNFYALLTMLMMVFIIFMKLDFGPMLLHENNARKGDLFTTGKGKPIGAESKKKEKAGHVSDLVIPVVFLIIGCVIGMIYTGGFFQGKSFIDAFASSDASVGLVLGSSIALFITITYYLLRQSLTFGECMDCLPEGFKQMVPAMLILTFAWTLKSMTDSLGAATYVAGLMEHSAASLMGFLPAIIFLVAIGLAFASGTSWGTFGILIPIVVSCFQEVDPQLMIISISACMAGAVCGDHCSPISDTTIMSSAGAQCEHLNHVTTQLPYALTAATVSFFTFLVAGFTKSALISLAFGMVALFLVLMFFRRRHLSGR